MEFLRGQFEEEIDEEGEVIIAGQTFLRHNILHDLDPEVYKTAFDEWIETRKIEFLETADRILSRYDNESRFEQLSQTFRSGKMLPFIGAGMSVGSGFPGWTRFLSQLCAESHVPLDNLDSLLKNGQYEEAAQLLYDDLGPTLFNESLQSTFARERVPSGPINYLPLLFPNTSVLTTNFDRVVERIYEDNTHQGFDKVQSGKALNEVLRQLAEGSRLLIKLHGDCRQIGERVLLKSEYTDYYAEDGAVRQFFNRVMFGQSIFFLGCSLCSDRTIMAMKEVVAESGSETLPRHYAILELKGSDDRVARKKYLAEANIFPIWYEEGDHDESIEALFMKLSQD